MYDLKIIAAVKDYMLRHKQTLAVAESVTSGHMQAAFSLADGASDFFQGGITTYNLGQKSRHLRIEPIRAMACNCVSGQTAEEMALQCLSFFTSDWGIAITGYAAPVPELEIKDLFAFCAVAFRGKVVLSKKLTAKKDSIYDVQVYYTERVLNEINDYLRNQ
jgi:PncC family amidohydrolase